MKRRFMCAAVIYAALSSGAAFAEDLTIFGPWLGPDQERLEEVLAAFAEAYGHNVSYVGSDSYEQQIIVDAEAGSAPNVTIFTQPGLAADMAARGFLTPLRAGTDDWVRENYAAGESWVGLGTYKDGRGEENFYAFPYKADLKSLVWYVPENFEDAGYEIPETMEELKALTQQIADDGETPWCIGLASGGATGWPATDWVEDMMLRTQPPEVYDQWVRNEIPFTGDAVIGAIEEFGFFARNNAYTAGGAGSVASTDFRDSARGLFSSPPQCYMHRQASFIPVFFPEGVEVGVDADFFYLPAYADKDLGKPVLGAGTLFVITKENDAAHDLITFLQTPEAHEIWMARGGFLTPHLGVDVSKFSDDPTARMNEILLNATTFRFDASDLMPGAVGTGSFWTGMIDYVGGKSAQQVTRDIQASWDALKRK